MESQGDTNIKRNPKLLEEVRRTLRLLRYSIHSERTYIEWSKRYVPFHKMQSRDELQPAEPKIEAFLTSLALEKNVAPATQNKAMNVYLPL